MKTFIRPLLVCAAAVVTVFLTGCQTASSPGTVSGGTRPLTAPRDDVSGMPWNGPSRGEDAVRYGGMPAPAPEVRSRPGLATQAGGENYAPVQDGWFHRKSSGMPDATDSFYYNDEAGAKAMTDALGGSRQHGGLFPVATDRLRTGLQYCGDDLPWLEARGQRVVMGSAGQGFGIHLKNATKHRLEVVVSVDGLDVLDGKAASVKKNGYVLEAGQEYTIQGFRKNQNQVKQFIFGSVSQSEAAKKGQARNVGVVGLAVYEEDEAAARAAQLAEAFKRSGASAFPRN